jgi:hypothetical protein
MNSSDTVDYLYSIMFIGDNTDINIAKAAIAKSMSAKADDEFDYLYFDNLAIIETKKKNMRLVNKSICNIAARVKKQTNSMDRRLFNVRSLVYLIGGMCRQLYKGMIPNAISVLVIDSILTGLGIGFELSPVTIVFDIPLKVGVYTINMFCDNDCIIKSCGEEFLIHDYNSDIVSYSDAHVVDEFMLTLSTLMILQDITYQHKSDCKYIAELLPISLLESVYVYNCCCDCFKENTTPLYCFGLNDINRQSLHLDSEFYIGHEVKVTPRSIADRIKKILFV